MLGHSGTEIFRCSKISPVSGGDLKASLQNDIFEEAPVTIKT